VLLAAGCVPIFAGAALALPGGSDVVTHGAVTPNRGAKGITLGMTREQTVKLEDGEQVVWLKGRYRGCKTFTDFGPAGRPASARIGMVFIGFQSGSAC
jgi:nicotinamide mononucleotide (NMN) deamidase PncC